MLTVFANFNKCPLFKQNISKYSREGPGCNCLDKISTSWHSDFLLTWTFLVHTIHHFRGCLQKRHNIEFLHSVGSLTRQPISQTKFLSKTKLVAVEQEGSSLSVQAGKVFRKAKLNKSGKSAVFLRGVPEWLSLPLLNKMFWSDGLWAPVTPTSLAPKTLCVRYKQTQTHDTLPWGSSVGLKRYLLLILFKPDSDASLCDIVLE